MVFSEKVLGSESIGSSPEASLLPSMMNRGGRWIFLLVPVLALTALESCYHSDGSGDADAREGVFDEQETSWDAGDPADGEEDFSDGPDSEAPDEIDPGDSIDMDGETPGPCEWRAVSAGAGHTCAVLAAGGVKCWGCNMGGQLGDGSTADTSLPVDVSGMSSGVSDVAVGGAHTCAILGTGGVKCWGSNNFGQLGDGTTTDSLVPADVSGLVSGAYAIAAGSSHTCALLITGGVKCWGSNASGQLGDGTTVDRLIPVDVSGLSSGVSAISAGREHTCALLDTGGVKCWGGNFEGQLGDGSATSRPTPGDVPGLTSGVSAMAAGHSHTCAVLGAGGMKCWGRNLYGELGDGSTENRTTPVDVLGLHLEISAASAGRDQTCILLETGGLMCWGANAFGCLGDGSTMDSSVPVDVSGMSSGVTSVSVGGNHACALLDGGEVKCWGDNWYGQLGDGSARMRTTSVGVSGLAAGVRAVAAGGAHTCVLLEDGGTMCWGANYQGQLGDGSTAWSREVPVDVVGLDSQPSAMSAGGSVFSNGHTCALVASGGVACWGDNIYGQLGDGTMLGRPVPGDVFGLDSGVSAVVAGGIHTCALTDAGGMKCWGSNGSGQLGSVLAPEISTTPVDVFGSTMGVTAAAAGGEHTCAILAAEGLKCWGESMYGQVGNGSMGRIEYPVSVSGLSAGVLAVATGYAHTCALVTMGGIKCWGWNESGQVGDGTTGNRTTPVDVSGLDAGVSSVTAGGAHTCALTDTGGVKCWGENESGQVGDGAHEDRLVPVDVSGLTSGVSAVAAGGAHTCALLDTGGVRCWGENAYYQLGDGSAAFRTTPHDIFCE